MRIDKTAIVHPKARLDQGVSIGPYSVIGEHVVLGRNVNVGPSCVITGHTTVGDECSFFTGSIIGSVPQDKKFMQDENVFLEIGSHNVFREYVTVNLGTGAGGKTVIANHNLFMAYFHVAHDCVVGSHCVLANSGALAGHVIVEDRVVIGGLTAVHQFVRVGRLSIVGGCSKVVQDIPPYSTCDGHPAKIYGLNTTGLKRANVSLETMRLLRKAFKILFHSGVNRSHAIEKIETELTLIPEVEQLLTFVKTSRRGLCGG